MHIMLKMKTIIKMFTDHQTNEKDGVALQTVYVFPHPMKTQIRLTSRYCEQRSLSYAVRLGAMLILEKDDLAPGAFLKA